jgi:hypothetical protein
MTGWAHILSVTIAYVVLVATSGYLVSFVLKKISNKGLEELAEQGVEEKEARKKTIYNVGNVIGKCENILVLTFMLLDAYTAIALVFTAKTIIRKEDIEKNSVYFLAGTLVNVCYSVLMGFITKVIIANT